MNGKTYYKCIRASNKDVTTNMVNKPLSEGGTPEGEFTLVPTSMTTKEASVWYRIEFNEIADQYFLNGYVLGEGTKAPGIFTIDRNGAGYELGSGEKLSEYSKSNPCWMRFDTLAASAASADYAEILTLE